MDFETLLEVRTSNLDNLGSMPFFDAAADYPVELIRLFLERLKKEGFSTSKEEARKIVNNVKESVSGRGSSLSSQNIWFDNNQFKIVLMLKSSILDLALSMRIDTNTLYYRIEGDFNSFDKITKITSRSTNQVVNSVISETIRLAKEIQLTSDLDIKKRSINSRELRSREKESFFKDIKKAEEIVKKFGFNLEVDRKESNKIAFKITPGEIWGIKTGRYQDGVIKDYLSEELLSFLKDFSFGFQIENLKRIFPHILRQVKNNGLTIVGGPHFGNQMVWFDTAVIDPDKSIPNTLAIPEPTPAGREKTYREKEEFAIEDFKNHLNEIKPKRPESKSDIQHRIINELLSREKNG